MGSSPHTRGALNTLIRIGRDHGIIPAYAGSTASLGSGLELSPDHPRIRGEHTSGARPPAGARGSSPHTRGAPSGGKEETEVYKDHPRIRGEHGSASSCRRCGMGSSPHTRGAPVAGDGGVLLTRIIPAYAGSTSPSNSPRARAGDHPRIRGEHSLAQIGTQSRDGSSPHTRGAPEARRVARRRGRIIPAYAGST